jgi:hypothetical protein
VLSGIAVKLSVAQAARSEVAERSGLAESARCA